jgi:hypothetical protein
LNSTQTSNTAGGDGGDDQEKIPPEIAALLGGATLPKVCIKHGVSATVHECIAKYRMVPPFRFYSAYLACSWQEMVSALAAGRIGIKEITNWLNIQKSPFLK